MTSDFERELWAEAQHVHKAMRKGLSRFIESLFVSILQRTPFRTGNLLVQWQGGEKGTRVTRSKFKARTRKYSITRAGAVAQATGQLRAYLAGLTDPFSEMRLVNTAPYAQYVRGKGEEARLSDVVALIAREFDQQDIEVEL
jgi:hypothetical protein